MFRFVLHKMMNKKWMVLALLIGNILLIAITCANAMYSGAVLQRALVQDMAEYLSTTNKYPGLVSVEATANASVKGILDAAETVRNMPKEFGVDAVETVEYYYSAPSYAKADFERKGGMVKEVSLGYMKELEDHIELVAGRMYSDTLDEDGYIEVIVSEKGITSMKMTLNEGFSMMYLVDKDGNPLKAKVVGVFRNSASDDPYWVQSPSYLKRDCLMSDELFTELFLSDINPGTLKAQFHVLLDYTQLRGDKVTYYAKTSAEYNEYFLKRKGLSCRSNFTTIMDDFQETAKKVNTTLWVLQVPIFTLLAAFIFMVSRQMLEMEQNEIAVLKSRGASRLQIITTYLLQSVVLALISCVVGIPIGAYLVQVLGSANAFLEFVKRSALTVEVNGNILMFCGAAALFSIAAMVLPVFKHSSVTIVNHKQKKSRKSAAPLWQRIFLDVAVLGVSVYLLYNFYGQKDILSQRVSEGASLDPLLFIASSAFMIGTALFALRILPMITFLLYRIFKKLWNPSLYAAFLQVIRTRYSQSFIMVFLILTIAMGIFNAQTARTINTNEEEDIRYTIGADLALRESWKEHETAAGVTYEEPDFAKYLTLDGVESAAQVLNIKEGNATTSTGSTLKKVVQIMGIHTKDFGNTAWFKDELFKSHFYDYLNAMSTNPRAVLISRNFETNYNVKLGDPINFNDGNGHLTHGVVYGFVDYWPGYHLKDPEITRQGKEPYLIVANLNQLQADWGVMPYEVWIKTEGSSQFIYDFADETGTYFIKFRDANADVIAMKNDPVFQGTNGILTVGFCVVLMLCTVGFLIYWILSIKSRSLQFGIYRAMGMSMREIVAMLICEQIFISGTSIATGVLVGWLTSKLYIPLIQIAYAAYDNALALKLISEPGDMVRLMVIVAAMILVCMFILSWLISKMKIAQALKLGED